jgi:hypothetical protein
MKDDSMRCAEVREELPAFVRDRSGSLNVRRHLARCDECRSELARYESVLDSLTMLRSATVDAPQSLVRALTEIPSIEGRIDHLRTHLARNRRAYLSGVAVVAAGAAGAVALRGVRRPARA